MVLAGTNRHSNWGRHGGNRARAAVLAVAQPTTMRPLWTPDAQRRAGAVLMNLVGEVAEVTTVLGGQAVLLPDDGVWGVQVRHRGRWIIARHAPDQPWSPSWIFIDPEPRHAHYYVHSGESVARLCWCTPSQWDASFHLIVAVGCAMRFINEEL